jgi:MFS family permease
MFLLAVAAGVLAATGYAASRMATMPVLPVVVLTGVLSGAAHGFLYPALAALVADDAPPARRGAVVGVFSALFLSGQAGGAFAFGAFAHGLGYALMWTLLAVAVAIGGVVSLGLERPAYTAGNTREAAQENP